MAGRIEAMDLPNVEVLSIMQLTPEITLDIVDRDLVIFVDASVDTDELRIEDIEPNPKAKVMTHHGDPANLLSLSKPLGRAPVRSVLVSIPATNLPVGGVLSNSATRVSNHALEAVKVTLRSSC